MRYLLIILIIIACIFCISPVTARSLSTSSVYVYIISPVNIKFGLHGMRTAPAVTEIEGTGHHHLLVDIENLPDLDKPIPADDHHIHYGKGQTETLIDLIPGKNTLQLLFADFIYVPHEHVLKSEPITIHVKE